MTWGSKTIRVKGCSQCSGHKWFIFNSSVACSLPSLWNTSAQSTSMTLTFRLLAIRIHHLALTLTFLSSACCNVPEKPNTSWTNSPSSSDEALYSLLDSTLSSTTSHPELSPPFWFGVFLLSVSLHLVFMFFCFQTELSFILPLTLIPDQWFVSFIQPSLLPLPCWHFCYLSSPTLWPIPDFPFCSTWPLFGD